MTVISTGVGVVFVEDAGDETVGEHFFDMIRSDRGSAPYPRWAGYISLERPS